MGTITDLELRRAVANAVKMLESRSRSKHEIEARLTERGYGVEVIDAVVAQLTRAGLVDDPAFAKEWVGSRSRAKEPVGRVRLKHEMKIKGIAPEIAEEALSEVDDQQELDQAIRAAQRHKRPYIGSAGWAAERQRLLGYLQRRGYGWETIKAAIRHVLAAPMDDPPEEDYED